MADQPYILINTFSPTDGNIGALTKFQLSEMGSMAQEATDCGWLGNEVYRTEDGRLIVVTRFQSEAAKESWAETDRFKRHVDALAPLVQSIESIPVSLIASNGTGE